MLAVNALRFSYSESTPVYRFSFAAEPGAITTISGPSGSGKSTLLDLMAGFLRPTEGTIMLDGVDLVPLEPENRPVSLLLQSDSLFEHLSAARNVALGIAPGTGRSQVADKTQQALLEVGMNGTGEQIAATLSGGQKQRVALARTLLRDRPILLLDEPFSALDDATRATARDLVRILTVRHNWHTILVSHHADDIAALATRRYQLVDGALQEG